MHQAIAHNVCTKRLHATFAHNDCIRRLRQTTWTLLTWSAQAASGLFARVLLVVLFVTRRYQPGHDHPPGDHPPGDRSPPQDGHTRRIRRSGG
jgi:hypothetical protein